MRWPLPAAVVFQVAAAWHAGAAEGPRRYVSQDAKGGLLYDRDDRGNRIPDFSSCGYRGGGVDIPDVPVLVAVSPAVGDNGPRIQAAIDLVARRPADGRGVRGAVLLLAGRHEVTGGLRIATSGVVLRGQGDGPGGTVVVATGTGRRPLIRMEGDRDGRAVSGTPRRVADNYVPVGSQRLRLADAEGLRVGDTVFVTHPSTAAWVASLGMDRFPPGEKGSYLNWRPGTLDLRFDRIITAVDGPTVTIDAPLTTALDASLGAATFEIYTWPGRISHVGVENLRCE
ncbi:MAG: pectate lyase, partial [Planctomycetia bacterium]|nr:pectate lyase [Planctomycetia bacterium]